MDKKLGDRKGNGTNAPSVLCSPIGEITLAPCILKSSKVWTKDGQYMVGYGSRMSELLVNSQVIYITNGDVITNQLFVL